MLYNQMSPIEQDEYFESKFVSQLSLTELAYFHLDVRYARHRVKDGWVSSSLYDLKESLSASFNNVRTNQYVPMMVSFSILDQLGNLYAIQQQNCTYQNGIKRALSYFSNCNRAEIESLVTLRNGLLHDGSLISHSQNGRTHIIFRTDPTATNLLTFPATPWNGQYQNDLSPYLTLINLQKLKELVFNAIDIAKAELCNGNLDITNMAAREFYFKFLFKRDL